MHGTLAGTLGDPTRGFPESLLRDLRALRVRSLELRTSAMPQVRVRLQRFHRGRGA